MAKNDNTLEACLIELFPEALTRSAGIFHGGEQGTGRRQRRVGEMGRRDDQAAIRYFTAGDLASRAAANANGLGKFFGKRLSNFGISQQQRTAEDQQ